MEKTTNKTDSLSDRDIDKIAGLLDKTFTDRLAPLATKVDLQQTEQKLKDYIDEGIETVMEGIDNISKQLAEKERVDEIEKWAREVGEKVGVKLRIK